MNTKLNCLALLAFLILPFNVSGQEAAMEKKGPDSVAQLCQSAGLGLPFEQISLDNGSVLKFYADSFGAVALSEEGIAGNAPILTHPDLLEGTPADVYWAVTPDERPVPEVLMENHRSVAEEPYAGLSEGRERGWWLNSAQDLRSLAKVDHCVSGVQDFVCGTSQSSYPDGPGCFNNSNGSLSWTNGNGAVRRYRTGVCSHGTYDASIWWGYKGPAGCEYFQPITFIHQGRFTNRYFLWVWNGPNGAWPRSFRNTVTHVSGDSFDWGVRFKTYTGNSCTL